MPPSLTSLTDDDLVIDLETGWRPVQTSLPVLSCPRCYRFRLQREEWEKEEGEAMRFYYAETCEACGYHDSDAWE